MILGIDTATTLCSVALWDGERFQLWEQKNPTGHSSILLPMIKTAFEVAENKIDTLVVSRGPGSFTGIRIGVSAALGLQFSGQVDVVAVSSLKARSYLDDFEGIRLPIIDARRQRVYGACYGALEHEEINAPFAHFIDVLKERKEPIALIGEEIEEFHKTAEEELHRSITLVEAKNTAEGVIRAYLEGDYTKELTPIYLREVEAVRRKEQGDAYTGD